MRKFASVMSRISSVLEKIVRFICILLVVILVCTVFFQVARRTITGKSFVQIEELSIVLAAWCAFFTVSYAIRRNVHVRIEVFTEKLPFYVKHALGLLINIVVAIAFFVIVKYGWQLAINKMKVPMTVLPIKSGWWYMAFPVGLAFGCFFLLDNVVQQIVLLMNGPKAEEQKVA